MDNNAIKEHLYQFIINKTKFTGNLDYDKSLSEQMDLDSLDFITLAFDIENEFDASLTEDFEELGDTINSIANAIRRYEDATKK